MSPTTRVLRSYLPSACSVDRSDAMPASATTAALADTIRATFEWKGAYWEPYIFSGLIFFILCFGMSRYSMYLERRLKRDHR